MGQDAGSDTSQDDAAAGGQTADASTANADNGTAASTGYDTGQDQGNGTQAGTVVMNGGNIPASAAQGPPGTAGGDVITGSISVPGSSANTNGPDSGAGRQIVIIGTAQGTVESGEDNTGGGYGTESVPPGAKTDAERIAVLDGQLNDQLGQFDGMILGKRKEVIEKANEEGSGSSVTGTDAGGSEGNAKTAPLLTAMAKGSSSNSGSGNMPSMPGKSRQGDYQHTQATAEIPADIPDGSDDDVVARQLREAAMKETDPKLRERLWDEYRKYKKGVVGKQ